MIASCKLQGFLDLLTVRFEVPYRKLGFVLYTNIAKVLRAPYNESLTLFDRREPSKFVKSP